MAKEHDTQAFIDAAVQAELEKARKELLSGARASITKQRASSSPGTQQAPDWPSGESQLRRTEVRSRKPEIYAPDFGAKLIMAVIAQNETGEFVSRTTRNAIINSNGLTDFAALPEREKEIRLKKALSYDSYTRSTFAIQLRAEARLVGPNPTVEQVLNHHLPKVTNPEWLRVFQLMKRQYGHMNVEEFIKFAILRFKTVEDAKAIDAGVILFPLGQLAKELGIKPNLLIDATKNSGFLVKGEDEDYLLKVGNNIIFTARGKDRVIRAIQLMPKMRQGLRSFLLALDSVKHEEMAAREAKSLAEKAISSIEPTDEIVLGRAFLKEGMAERLANEILGGESLTPPGKSIWETPEDCFSDLTKCIGEMAEKREAEMARSDRLRPLSGAGVTTEETIASKKRIVRIFAMLEINPDLATTINPQFKAFQLLASIIIRKPKRLAELEQILLYSGSEYGQTRDGFLTTRIKIN